ncbi:MAG: histidinol-phosphate transaminase [Bacillota bacterium]|nr:histidinol-phosphate transaminase [Bacillota bacterium]
MIKSRKCIQNVLPYRPGKSLEDLKKNFGLSEIHQLSTNENPLGPSSSSIEAVRVASLRSARYPNGYSFDLRSALAKHLGVAVERLIFGAGSNEILKLLCLAYLDPDDEVIVPHPSFGEYGRLATVCGAKCKAIPLNGNFVADLPAMASAISSRTKIIFICNPNNPTGTVVDQRSMRQMLYRIGEDVMVVLDEAYHEYVDDPNSPDGIALQKEFPNVVAVRTFSHAYGLAGLRIGYAVAHESVVYEIDKVREPFHIGSVSQAAALAALNDREYLEKSILYNRMERDFLVERLREMGLAVLDSQANFLLVDVKTDAVRIFKGLLRRGVMVRSADAFGYPTAIRVSIGLREENNYFLKALMECLA